MDNLVVGIDLGTTFSSIAYVDEDGRPKVIPNADGKNATPSAVLIEGDQVAVGEVALNQWVINQEHVVRWISAPWADLEYRFQERSAVEISAEILKALKADAERYLGQPVAEAVITCPAYFAALEIENTKRAGELAGLRVREIVKEPTAAAVYYGVEHMQSGEKLLVCDLGGGTFNATVLAYDKGVFIPRASSGDHQLGGHDWTMDLVEIAARYLQEHDHDDPRNDLVANQMLYEACEQAKRDFARVDQVTISCQFQGRLVPVPVARADFEAETEWRIQALVMWAERALEKAQLTWRDLDRILLVGGASRLRRMALALEEKAGKKPVHSREPDLMVALGAAVLARGRVRPRKMAGGLVEAPHGGLVEVEYRRIISRSLGTRVIAFDGDAPRITNSLIIPHSTESPVVRTRDDYAVSSTGQKAFDVPVVEFESDQDYDVVGNYRFQCLPAAQRGDRIKVTFDYDLSGIVTVAAVDVKTGQPLAGERLTYEEPDLSKIGRVRVRPRWVVFALDTLGSMLGVKLAEAKRAVLAHARDLLALGGAPCKIGVVSFNSVAETACAPTADLSELERAVNGLTVTGTTAMDAGIELALAQVMAAPAGVDRDVIMVTDGMPDTNRRQDTLAAAQTARAGGVTLSSLGVGKEDVDEVFLKSLTPIALVIDGVDGLSAAMTTLLTQAAATHGGLTETPFGGLKETQDERVALQ